MPIKDRSTRSSWLLAIESIVITMLQENSASLSDEQKETLRGRIGENFRAAAAEFTALAPTGPVRGALSPDAARKVAAQITTVGNYLLGEFMDEALGASTPAPAAPTAPPSPTTQ